MKITTSLYFVFLLGIAIPSASFACHKTDAGGDPIAHGKNGNCDSTGGDGSGGPGKIELRLRFDDFPEDTIQSDLLGDYVNRGGNAKVQAGGDPAQLNLGFEGGKKPNRDVFLKFTCEPIPGVTDLGVTDPCEEVAAFEEGEFGWTAIVATRPYGTCPFGDCPDVFEMGTGSENSELMIFSLSSLSGWHIEISSFAGVPGDSAGLGSCMRQLTMLEQEAYLETAGCLPDNLQKCNVTVTAEHKNAGGQNDFWSVETPSEGVKALICNPSRSGYPIGQTTLTFGFRAWEKSCGDNPCDSP